MGLKFFHISSRSPDSIEAELNVFLARHRVVTVERRFVEDGADSFWAVCVDYLSGEAGSGTVHGAPGRSERKVDYKEVLSPEQFVVFAKLRELRKIVAEREAVPVYAVFTNEQLAVMVQERVNNRVKLRRIDGVGEAKVDKYGGEFLGALSAEFGQDASLIQHSSGLEIRGQAIGCR